MAKLIWNETQLVPIPDDGSPVLVAWPLDDGSDACYAAAYMTECSDLESLCGGEITFPATHWLPLTPPNRAIKECDKK